MYIYHCDHFVLNQFSTDSDGFEVNSNGEILTKQELDYETDVAYSLTVFATDNGNPMRSVSHEYIELSFKVNLQTFCKL